LLRRPKALSSRRSHPASREERRDLAGWFSLATGDESAWLRTSSVPACKVSPPSPASRVRSSRRHIVREARAGRSTQRLGRSYTRQLRTSGTSIIPSLCICMKRLQFRKFDPKSGKRCCSRLLFYRQNIQKSFR